MSRPPILLVVDDTPHNIKLLDAVLAPRGYTVVPARSGQEALDRVVAEPPDLVLLDVVMPGIDGYEVCRRLRGDPATCMLPVVMITASGDQEKTKAIEAGADDFITKPFNQAELLARIGSLLRIKVYHDTINQQAAQLAEWNRRLEERVQQQVEELERVGRLKRFLAPQLAELIVSSGDEGLLESHRREITVVYCDLRGFTALSESVEPEEVMAVLHEYHTAVGQLIFRFEGTLDHFAGGSLAVFFNDPLPVPEPAGQAVRLALAIREQVGTLIERWRRRGYELGFGAGIATGYATLGQIGFEGRYDYAAIGTVTTLASRLCNSAAADQILISQRVYAAVEELVVVQAVGELEVKDFSRPVFAYNVIELKRPQDLAAPASAPPDPPDLAGLSEREVEVLRFVAQGLTNPEIAEKLILSPFTINAHLRSIFGKIEVTSRSAATRWAVDHRLV
jgi:adenylate cyclase